MILTYAKPPIWDEAVKLFKFDVDRTVFTYGNILFNPGHVPIEGHLWAHEETHAKQQAHDETVAKLWWKRYFEDPPFRLDQETEAYGNQYRYICEKLTKDRNKRYKILSELAQFLSGPMYGKIIGHTEAIRRIQLASGIHKNREGNKGSLPEGGTVGK